MENICFDCGCMNLRNASTKKVKGFDLNYAGTIRVSLLYGAAWAGASIIWETDRWSILRQTTTRLIVCSLSTFPIAHFFADSREGRLS